MNIFKLQDEEYGPRPSIEPPSESAIITEWPAKDTSFPWIVGHTGNEGVLVSAGKPFTNSYFLFNCPVLYLN